MKEIPEIYIENLKRKISYREQESLLDACLRQKVPISTSCGGMGTCTACRIVVVKAPHPLAERNEIEEEQANERNFVPNERLACQVIPTNGLTVEIPNLQTNRDF